MGVTVVLHNIRSVHNVGSIFRTCDAAGVKRIILSGYTPAPVDRFGRERTDLSKVALGAEKYIEWEQVKQIAPVLKRLKKEGYLIVAVEQDKKSTPLFDFKLKGKTALIFGSEVKGLTKAVLKRADTVVEIPMQGRKESLNVSVTAGIVLFTLLK